ncbi:type II toxin-antitoxin system prevent-host-death family antitoxin [Actinoplanes octamycinicus]|nr:antitoxin YefM [Actinoplanes octamycinicus]
MKVMTISEVRRNFAAVVDAVIDDAEEAVIPRGGGRAVVIVSLDEWNSMKETLHLLDTPGRARRLLESIAQADAGLVTDRELIDPATLAPETNGEPKAVA